MEKFPKTDSGRGPTDPASATSADTIPPTLQTASESSSVGRATIDPAAPTATEVAGRSRRRRKNLSSTSSSVSRAHIAVPPEQSKRSSSSSGTTSSRSVTAESVALSHGGESSTTASASSRPAEELMSSQNARKATSRSGGPRTDGLTREDRKDRRGEAFSVEGSRPLPAMLERASRESPPAEISVECSAEKSGTNLSKPRYREPPGGMELRTKVGALSPSMTQLQHLTTKRDSKLEGGSIMHRPDTAVPGPAAAPKKNHRSLAAVNSKRKLQTTLGTRTGATELAPNIQDLLKLKKPALEKRSPWRSLHAIIMEEALQHRRRFVFGLGLCTTAGSILLGLLTHGIFGRDNLSAVNACGNNDCIFHVATLSLPHNEDIASPCKNFAHFVCSRVKNKYSYLADSVVTQRILHQTNEIIKQRVNHSVFRRPSEMIRRCLDANSRDDATLNFFVEFLRNKSFAWPTPGETDDFPDANSRNYSQPLKILLDLAVTWAVPIWFRCNLLFRNDFSDRAVRLAPSDMGHAAKIYHQFVVNTNLYPTYVDFIASIIFSLREPTPAFASFVRRSKIMQEEIYDNLSITFTTSIINPKKVPLKELPSFVGGLTVNDWQRVLRSVYDVHPPISRDDVVFVTNHRLLVVMCTLFKAYTPQEIAFHTVWWFAQTACTLSSSLLFNAISSVRLGSQVLSAYCTAITKGFYNILLAAASKADTSSQNQIRINNCFENVRTAAVDKLESMTHIEKLTNDSFQTMFTQTANYRLAQWQFGKPRRLATSLRSSV
ncbi:hypothetical protein HPB49_016846 [Dermacentor silvarum]|uniref:Uncharacterized protein n=1 Tax=Dermacentor silvarum TaxID=543639 RepID=A0ACB8CM02_DERSI|nr:hypothetical protein HPB49_016846 [Dermacentor silvarum]